MKIKSDLQEMQRRPGRPSLDRRDEILDAAERLYQEIGFEKTTVTDVARALQMSAANLYRSFPNRRAIDEAVAGRRLGKIEDVAWLAARHAAIDPAVALERLIIDVLNTSKSTFFGDDRLDQLCSVAARERWPVVVSYIQSLNGALRHVVTEGRRLGRFDEGFEIESMVRAAALALTRVWHPYVLEIYRDTDSESEARSLAQLILGAINKR